MVSAAVYPRVSYVSRECSISAIEDTSQVASSASDNVDSMVRRTGWDKRRLANHLILFRRIRSKYLWFGLTSRYSVGASYWNISPVRAADMRFEIETIIGTDVII